MHFGLAVERIRAEMDRQGWDIAGVPINKEMVHDILTQRCGGVGTFGEMIRLSEQDTEECCKFFKNIQMWAAKNLHIDIGEPDPDWKKE